MNKHERKQNARAVHRKLKVKPDNHKK